VRRATSTERRVMRPMSAAVTSSPRWFHVDAVWGIYPWLDAGPVGPTRDRHVVAPPRWIRRL